MPHPHEEDAMKRALVRLCIVALECAAWILPYFAAWILRHL